MEKKIEQFILFRIRAFSDQKAFERLVMEYGPKIDKFLRLRLPRIEDAQDIYAEVWTQTWTYAQNAKIDSVSGLLHTIARRMVANFYAKRESRPESFQAEEYQDAHLSVPLHEDIISKIDAKLLKEIMCELDEDESEIILLRFIEGYQVKEIAKYLGRTENATSVKLFRSIKKLRDIIKQKFGDV